MRAFQIIALTPPGMTDPTIAIAACRAGEIGMLDLEYAERGETVHKAIIELSRCGRGKCGVKLNGGDEAFLSWIIPGLPGRIEVAVLSRTGPGDPARMVRALHDRGISVLLEAISVADARRGVKAGVDGLVVKGNEAGGRVGEESAFVLLQGVLKESSLPVWVQGGIGIHTAAACYAAGAAGIVLDSQLALSSESSFPDPIRQLIAGMDGSETVCLGGGAGAAYRVYSKPISLAVKELSRHERSRDGMVPDADTTAKWDSEVRKRIGWSDPVHNVLPLGQDASFAGPLAKRFRTVEGILRGLREAIGPHVDAVRDSNPISRASALARSHGTLFPIVQGPMARISDNAGFLLKVAEEGALPFFAMGLSGAVEIEVSLRETHELMKGRPWGVGLLGFAPREILDRQLELIDRYRPPFALIAGGNPEQARLLEGKGIGTYLHVPSPGLLEIFLEKGVRRFIFEGRECGGHIGPRTSFVLWDSAVEMLMNSLSEKDMSECHILFAGGVHDALSASMVAALAAPVAIRGAKIGLQVGTAYLFTEDAVSTGAIVKGYQQEAIRCRRTAIVESSPGHASRCSVTPYVEAFRTFRRKLVAEGRQAAEIARELEEMNLGRLRVASRGIERNPRSGEDREARRYVELGLEEQRTKGMYMIGQIAALRDRTTSIGDLHEDICGKGSRMAETLDADETGPSTPERGGQACDVAIIGMSCLFPKANGLYAYWENILKKVDAITEIPKERWDWNLFYDGDPKARDRFNSKWGGFLEAIPFDPVTYGMTPDALKSIEPVQLLSLEAARAALKDAGYESRDFPRERTSVIFGAGASMSDMGQQYILRSSLPGMPGDLPPQALADRLPEWTSDSFSGILPNVIVGRIANRFNLGGLNFTVDAACASSLAAVYHAVKEIASRSSDMVVVGGADTFQSPFAYFCFGKTQALSPTGRSRPFDEGADGICISEGIGVLVMKRLSDAVRDRDRIYAVIKGVGGSSDGRSKGITAPNVEGQVRAIRRAWDGAGIPPSTAGLIEAHGTGTPVGDEAEIQTLLTVLRSGESPPRSCALGSVKSAIGHTKCAAGVAGLIKTSLALYHKVLPPTIGVDKPRRILADGPLYVNTEARPWLRKDSTPRRAGVSGFGFGGTNFHVVVEECAEEARGDDREAVARDWPSELFLWDGTSREELTSALGALLESLHRGASPEMRDLSFTLWEKIKNRSAGPKLAIVAASTEDLRKKLTRALHKLRAGETGPIHDPGGIYFNPRPPSGKIAFLFPGQGSQYPDMVRDLAVHFPEVRERFDIAGTLLHDRLSRPLGSYVYPAPGFSKDEEERSRKDLAQTNVAQPALGAADMGLFTLLRELGVEPDMAAGHSYGEYVALCVAGVFKEDVLYRISEARGRFILEEAGKELGTMSAVEAGCDKVSGIVRGLPEIWVSNLNSPMQTVISGTREGIRIATDKLQAGGINTHPVAVSCAFHSPLVSQACEKLKKLLFSLKFSSPGIDVFSNTTAGIYPGRPEDISALLGEHLVNPVRFMEMIEGMYGSGARVFVEVGPRKVLTSLVRQILGDRPHLALPLDIPDRNGLLQLHHALGQLAACGVPVRLDRLYRGRSARALDLDVLVEGIGKKLSPTTFMVDGGRAVPLARAAAPAPKVPSVPLAPEKEIQGPGQGDSGSQAIAGNVPGSRNGLPEPPSQGKEIYRLAQDHHQLMRQFLETHRQVMTALLRDASPETGGPDEEFLPESTFEELRKSIGGLPAGGPEVPSSRSAAEAVADGDPVGRVTAGPTGSAGPPAGQTLLPVSPSFDVVRIADDLVRIVSERTGYPPEMLDLNLDMEADLGIDSIKRTEILGVVQKKYPDLAGSGDGAATEELRKIKTLQGIIDWLGRSAAPAARGATSGEISARPESKSGTGLPCEAPGVDKELIRDDLVRIVSERTGYPPEMLDLNLDMEADLGIDSIKRTEILGVVQKKYPDLAGSGDGAATEELRKIKTLQGIIDFLAGSSRLPPPEGTERVPLPPEKATGSPPSEDDDDEARVSRYVVKPVEAPLHVTPLRIPPGAVFVVTSDGDGFSRIVAERISEQGGRTAVVRIGKEFQDAGDGNYTANLADPDAVNALMDSVRRRIGPVDGIIHLLPFAPGKPIQDMDLRDWRESMRRNVKSLFLMARAAAEDIKRSANAGGGWLIAACPREDSPPGDVVKGLSPVHGGLAGMLKTIAQEWPQATCKAVSAGTEPASHGFVECLMNEMSDRQGEVEVIYSGSQRFILRTMPVPVDERSALRLEMDREWVVMVTGGARGITAEAALELARRYHPTMILVGRSPLPAESEDEDTAGMRSTGDLRTALLDRCRKEGRQVKPVEIEAACRKILRDREIRANMKAMTNVGATVRYFEADVRDERSFGGVMDRVYGEFGRLDGVIHGAGIIEDKLIEDKAPDSFDRVFNTKADSAFILGKKLRIPSLKFVVYFSSIAGRFGSRGQCDYAATNDVVNKLANRLDGRWPCRIVSANWGPWSQSTGMVSEQVQRQFVRRGIRPVPLAAGRKALHDEIMHGDKGDVEVVFGDGPWASAAAQFPLLHRARLSRDENGVVEVDKTFDPGSDLYLRDHLLDGKPVVPVTFVMELMVEAAQWTRRDRVAAGIHSFQFFKGIILDGGGGRVRVVAKPGGPEGSQGAGEIEIEVTEPGHPGRPLYRGVVEMVKRPLEPPEIDERPFGNLPAFPMTVPEAYQRWLFHGPLMQRIVSVEGMSGDAISGVINPSSPDACIADRSPGPWLIHPVVLDCAFQLVLLWERGHHDMTGLPSRIASFRWYGALPGRSLRCHVRAKASNEGAHVLADIWLIDREGRLAGSFEKAEFTASKALNRLSDSKRSYAESGT